MDRSAECLGNILHCSSIAAPPQEHRNQTYRHIHVGLQTDIHRQTNPRTDRRPPLYMHLSYSKNTTYGVLIPYFISFIHRMYLVPLRNRPTLRCSPSWGWRKRTVYVCNCACICFMYTCVYLFIFEELVKALSGGSCNGRCKSRIRTKLRYK